MTDDAVTPSTPPVTPRDDDRLYAEDVAAARGVTKDEYLSHLRDVAAALAADSSRCTACEGPLPEGSQRDTCDDACRQAKSRAAREQSHRDQEQA